jgi:hypothetical protein
VQTAIFRAVAGDITKDQKQKDIIAIRQRIAEMEIGIRLVGRADTRVGVDYQPAA